MGDATFHLCMLFWPQDEGQNDDEHNEQNDTVPLLGLRKICRKKALKKKNWKKLPVLGMPEDKSGQGNINN